MMIVLGQFDVCNYFLRKLKDRGLLVIRHIASEVNDADIFTNLTSAMLNRRIPLYIKDDQYESMHDQDLSWEAAGNRIHSNLERG